MESDTKNSWDVGLSILQLLFVAATAIWAFFRFRRERLHKPRVGLTISAIPYGPFGESVVLHFMMTISNSGNVIHVVTGIQLRVRGILTDDKIASWEGNEGRVAFPHKLVDASDVLYKKKYKSIFVEPGVTQAISYVAHVPSDTKLALARAEFQYDDSKSHSSEVLVDVAKFCSQPGDAVDATSRAKH